jgi:dihydroflavonol-4-reductase
MDVFAAPRRRTLVETNIDKHPKSTAYERSEAGRGTRDGGVSPRPDVVYMNPGAVYGPSPVHVVNSFSSSF